VSADDSVIQISYILSELFLKTSTGTTHNGRQGAVISNKVVEFLTSGFVNVHLTYFILFYFIF
jgi:hypothetical protein